MKNLNVIFNGIAVAMGVAIIVLNIVNPLSLAGATTLLGIGVAALGSLICGRHEDESHRDPGSKEILWGESRCAGRQL